MIWLILIIVIGFLVYLMNDFGEKSSEFEKNNNISIHNLLNSGTYVSGHPSLDEPVNNTKIHLDSNDVKIFTGFAERATIPKNTITNVIMEDSSTIQNRVGVKRLLLVGIFAFAWKKKQKLESAYLVIEWKSGNFENETIFEFEGEGSIKLANTLRNRFIEYLSKDTSVIQIDKSEEDLYIDLIQKNRKIEAINLYVHKNKVTLKQAQDYIESIIV